MQQGHSHSELANSTNTNSILSPESKGSNPEISQEHDEGLKNLQTLTVFPEPQSNKSTPISS
jgi:hypothetical protein